MKCGGALINGFGTCNRVAYWLSNGGVAYCPIHRMVMIQRCINMRDPGRPWDGARAYARAGFERMSSRRFKVWRLAVAPPGVAAYIIDDLLLRCGTLRSAPDFGTKDAGNFPGDVGEFMSYAYQRTGHVGSVVLKDFDSDRCYVGYRLEGVGRFVLDLHEVDPRTVTRQNDLPPNDLVASVE